MKTVDEARGSIDAGGGAYTATFELAEDGWWVAQVVEVPEAISQGRTLEDAKDNVAYALAAALELRRDEGREVPSAGRVVAGPVSASTRR